MLHRLPPNAVDLEESVLGAALLERQGQIIALEKLSATDFFSTIHQEIFIAVAQLAKDGNPVDIRTVGHQLDKNGKIGMVGGRYYLAELASKVSSAANIEYHCLVIIEKRIRRNIIDFATRLTQFGYDEGNDVFNLLNDITAFPLDIIEAIKGGNERKIKDGVVAIAQSINKRETEVKELTGVPSGYESLDKLTHGWQPGALIIIAARPSMGKTTFVINTARNAAIDFKIPVAIFSLEMTAQELELKFVSLESDFEIRALKTKLFNPYDIEHFMVSTRRLAEAPIWIDDTPAISILDLRVRCRRMVEKYGVKMIIVDYLQLMKGEPHTLKNREQEISSISRGLKQIAKELKIPVLALSQLSRDVEKRETKIPILSDLRESGSLEQDADLVMFMWRPAYYKKLGDEAGTYIDGLTKLIIAKHRNGPVGEAFLTMLPRTSKFQSAVHEYLQGQAADTQEEKVKELAPVTAPEDETPF